MPLLPVTDDRIMMKHGAGGRAMRRMIHDTVLGAFHAERETAGVIGLRALDDGAAIRVGDRWLILTTDSHVIQPPFFPGGDIGRLAVCGTVNDLAMMGATEVLGLTCSVIIEEGFPRRDLERILASMQAACLEAGAEILTGDTKVMGKGEIDGIVINTAGVGMTSRVISDRGLHPGDRILVTGMLGDITPARAVTNMINALGKGVLKVMSKMGISTVGSYRQAQVFAAFGIDEEVLGEYFTGTTSRTGGSDLGVIAEDILERHSLAFVANAAVREHRGLEIGGQYQWRREGEYQQLACTPLFHRAREPAVPATTPPTRGFAPRRPFPFWQK